MADRDVPAAVPFFAFGTDYFSHYTRGGGVGCAHLPVCLCAWFTCVEGHGGFGL